MKCKKCGYDTLFKDGDWFKCSNCGAVMFDVAMGEDSPTRAVEQIESQENDSNIRLDEAEESTQQDTQQAQVTEEESEEPEKSKIREIIEFCTPIVIAIVIAILLKHFVFANVVVPTGSMLNTIHEGDRIIASRLAYIKDDPQRYDVVIFKYPDDETQPFVKRVIGLPGETVEIINGVVYVTKPNGEEIKLDDAFITVDEPEGSFGPFKVPEGHYFMMGDNRNNSWDSRYWNNKYVAEEKIIGKAMFRYYPSIGAVE